MKIVKLETSKDAGVLKKELLNEVYLFPPIHHPAILIGIIVLHVIIFNAFLFLLLTEFHFAKAVIKADSGAEEEYFVITVV